MMKRILDYIKGFIRSIRNVNDDDVDDCDNIEKMITDTIEEYGGYNSISSFDNITPLSKQEFCRTCDAFSIRTRFGYAESDICKIYDSIHQEVIDNKISFDIIKQQLLYPIKLSISDIKNIINKYITKPYLNDNTISKHQWLSSLEGRYIQDAFNFTLMMYFICNYFDDIEIERYICGYGYDYTEKISSLNSLQFQTSDCNRWKSGIIDWSVGMKIPAKYIITHAEQYNFIVALFEHLLHEYSNNNSTPHMLELNDSIIVTLFERWVKNYSSDWDMNIALSSILQDIGASIGIKKTQNLNGIWNIYIDNIRPINNITSSILESLTDKELNVLYQIQMIGQVSINHLVFYTNYSSVDLYKCINVLFFNHLIRIDKEDKDLLGTYKLTEHYVNILKELRRNDCVSDN